MQFPNSAILVNGSKMNGEEVFLRGLYELATGASKMEIAEIFGRYYSDQSRSFDYFINRMYNMFHHLVDNNLH